MQNLECLQDGDEKANFSFKGKKKTNGRKKHPKEAKEEDDASSSKDKSKQKCFFCGKKRHYASECYKRLRAQVENDKQGNLAKEEEEDEVDVFLMAFTSSLTSNSNSRDNWWIDSGASSHMSCEKDFFSILHSFNDAKMFVFTANDEECRIDGVGTISLCLESSKYMDLENVLYVPSITKNMLSVGLLLESGLDVHFKHGVCFILKNDVCIAKAFKHGRLFKLEASVAFKRVSLAKEEITQEEILAKCDLACIEEEHKKEEDLEDQSQSMTVPRE
ncbi:hypothetical protein O6H91_Y125700 [Diphasiastrum complanatum]|nr:hypothetical protein O6H91_Y125700 [Diphasiastrum complanatum]